MKVLVLLHSSLIPPDSPKVNKEELESMPWRTEYNVIKALHKLKHNVKVLGVDYEIKPIREAIETFKPKVVFNLLEEFAGEAVFDQNVVSYLEMLRANYTGCNPRGLMLARDKALAKKILTYHRIPTPKFQVFPRGRKPVVTKTLKFPLFVKTLNEEASLGITQGSIVENYEQMKDRVSLIHSKYEVDAIAENYIEGREFYVSIMGNNRLQVLPVWELFFNKVTENTPKIATSKVKWDAAYRKKYGIKLGKAKIDKELEERIQKVARRSYKALGLTGYARIDLRVNAEGEVFVIEANPNPDIAYGDEFAQASELQGYSYEQLIEKILRLSIR